MAARKCEVGLEDDYVKLRQEARVRIPAASSGRAAGNVNIREIFDEEKAKSSSIANVDTTALYNTMIGPLTKCAAKREAR